LIISLFFISFRKISGSKEKSKERNIFAPFLCGLDIHYWLILCIAACKKTSKYFKTSQKKLAADFDLTSPKNPPICEKSVLIP